MVFSDYVKLIQIATNVTDEILNEYTDTDITRLADECYVRINRKKK